MAKGCVVSQSHPLYITDQLEMFNLMGHNIVLNEVVGRVKPLVLNWLVLHISYATSFPSSLPSLPAPTPHITLPSYLTPFPAPPLQIIRFCALHALP